MQRLDANGTSYSKIAKFQWKLENFALRGGAVDIHKDQQNHADPGKLKVKIKQRMKA